MDFFESQDSARRNTGRLILLFGLAVISLILVTNFLVMLIFGFLSTEMTSAGVLTAWQFNWQVFVMVGVLVAAVIILGSLYKIVSLSGGGARVAEMMNGRLLVAGTGDLLEQRLMNVVEEMAIASGTPVPPIYVLEEAGINAFAAGYSPSDAVIGVTRGAIETLNREQLQGVVAHEFSHILHGDMRINIRLIGILHGIMVLGIIGYYLMRGSSFRSRSKDSGGVVMLGLGLLVIGYVGTFFPAFLFAFAQQYIDSAIAAILNALTPLLTIIFGLLFFRIDILRKQYFGVGIGLLGSIGLVWGGLQTASNINPVYTLLILAASCCYAMNIHFIKIHLAQVGVMAITLGNFVFMAPAALAVLIYSDFFTPQTFSHPDIYTGIGYITILALVGSAFAKYLFNKFVKITSAVFASSVTYTLPVVALFWGVYDEETITGFQLLSAAIIFIGVYLSHKKKAV